MAKETIETLRAELQQLEAEQAQVAKSIDETARTGDTEHKAALLRRREALTASASSLTTRIYPLRIAQLESEEAELRQTVPALADAAEQARQHSAAARLEWEGANHKLLTAQERQRVLRVDVSTLRRDFERITRLARARDR